MIRVVDKTSKGKAMVKMASLTKYEKNTNQTGFSVSLQKKEINGTPTITGKINRFCCSGIAEKQPLEQEFTDMEQFKEVVEAAIDNLQKGLA
jgi:hypothetical protein